MDTGPAQVVTTEVALDAGNDALLAHLLERYRFPEGYRRMFLAAIATFSSAASTAPAPGISRPGPG